MFTTAKKETKKKKCPICREEKSIATKFYKSSSPLFAIDGCVPICIDCIKQDVLNEDGTVNENRLKTMCQRLDKPFYVDELDNAFLQAKSEHGYLSDDEVAKQGKQIIGFYFKNINTLRQNKSKSFADSEKDEFTHRTSNVDSKQKKENITNRYNEVMETRNAQPVEVKFEDTKWTKKDKQNMKYVISTVGYDPFEDLGLSESDRKYCFNIMAGYCDTDGIVEDGNKMQGVIEMTNMYCQCKNFTAAINEEMSKNEPNDQKIARLTNSKTSMLSSISTIAKDNNIASNYNKNSKQGQNSLTSKMKEMSENNFEAIQVNLFDIKTSEAFKQIDKISNENIANQLTLDNSEFSDIVKEQREIIQEQESEISILQEENRNLKNKIIDLENRKR